VEIYRLALAIVGVDDAADVAQDVLVIAWRGRHRLRDETHAAAWLRRIVVNRCIDLGRRRSRTVRTIALEAVTDRMHPRLDAPEPRGFDIEIDRALRSMPVEQRAVLALHYAADLPLTDVAEALGIPAGTAKSRLHAALERLRTALGERST
jgi:RNA polymerase sigma factor (sigma-70 family)